MSPRRLCILGATGSVGQAALEVIQKRPDDFSIVALAAGSDDKKLAKLCRLHKPAYAALYDKGAAQRLKRELVNEETVVGAAKNLCWKRRLTPIVVRLSPPSPAAAARRQRLRRQKPLSVFYWQTKKP